MKQKIRQAYVSPSVSAFKRQFLRKYYLTPYRTSLRSLVIFGMYSFKDYNVFLRHPPPMVVVWCGGDALKIDARRESVLLKKTTGVTHYAMSGFVSNTLTRHGIPHKVLPITPTTPHMRVEPRGDMVYCYVGSDARKDFYGWHIVEQISKLIPYEVAVVRHSDYRQNELVRLYRKSFIGLRLTLHDGLPNTVLELGLMGRRCIYNGGLPHSIPWAGVEDIRESIMREYEIRGQPNAYIGKDTFNYINIGDDWLHI